MKTEKDFENYLETIKKIAAEEGYDSLDEVYTEHLRCRFLGRDVVIGRNERITLRELKKDDLEEIYGFWDGQEESVLKAFVKESREASQRCLEAYIEQQYGFFDYGIWAVIKNDEEKLIGLCGLGNPVIFGESCTDIGYYICPAFRNRGFAAESVEIALDYAKNYLEIPVICAIIKEENRISRAVLGKFDFEFAGQYQEAGQQISVYQKELKG